MSGRKLIKVDKDLLSPLLGSSGSSGASQKTKGTAVKRRPVIRVNIDADAAAASEAAARRLLVGRDIYDDEDEEEDVSQYLPATWISMLYAILIGVGLVLAIYVFIIAVREHSNADDVTALIDSLTATSMILTTSINNLNTIVVDIRNQLIIIESDIGELQDNVTSLGARIANISCIGIKTVNDAVATAALLIESGIAEFFEVTTVNLTNATVPGGLVLVNGTRLQLLLAAQQVSLDTLQALVASINAALALLESLTTRHIDAQPPLLNNIQLVGLCNASVSPGLAPSTVVIDACGIQANIDQQFQAIFAQFQVALAKIAILQANITYMNTTITLIENIIAEVQSKGLFTVNYRLPNATTGTIELLAEDIYLNITGTHITNEGIRSINGIAKNNITLAAGSGIGITNDAPSGTITVSNLNAAPTCQVQIQAFTANQQSLPNQASGFFDANFQPGGITTTPPGCYANASVTFRRIGYAFPTSFIVNTVCKPEGRWILQFESFMVVFAPTSTLSTFMNLMIYLTQSNVPLSIVPVFFWNMIMYQPSGFIGTSFQNIYTFPDTPAQCYNVTWYVRNPGSTIISANVLTTWTFTQID